jgi:5-methyltetrahydrofolate--homocysteine methyltransferase
VEAFFVDTLEQLNTAVQTGERDQAVELTQQALDAGVSALTILNESLMPAMTVVGEGMQSGELFIPEVMIAARAMAAATDLLQPLLAAAGAKPLGKAVIGTVKGDMHDIGKNLVRMMVKGKGIEVTDLGVDVSAEQFVSYLREHPDTHLLMLSTLLTTTLPMQGTIIKAVDAAGLRSQVKIMVGGAPCSAAYAKSIGADGYSEDAASAAELAARLLEAA